MKILIVDDEKAARMDLERAIRNIVEEPDIHMASNVKEALSTIRQTEFDVIFMDIQLTDGDGISFSRDILDVRPETNIIIQTANPQFALKAYALYVCDYIIKPVSENDIRSALEHLRWPKECSLKKIEVRCFGKFEVFWNGKPLLFKRRKTKELLAYLIDCNGGVATSEDIATALWEEIDSMSNAKMNIRAYISDLKNTLESIGMGDALVRKRGEIAIRRDMIDCDYFRYIDGDEETIDKFHGEYMSQYSWAEYKEGELWFH